MEIKLCNKADCTGCLACLNACKKAAIDKIYDERGFVYPIIAYDRCVSCGACLKVCPIIDNKLQLNPQPQNVYAVWSNNKDVVADSSSGGFFSTLSLYVLENGGIVFGAAFDEDLNLHHVEIKNYKDLFKLRGSKYLQSDIDYCYRKVKERLKEGHLTLFSGTPCQISGLKKFLNRDFDNLITLDMLCHGVPSNRVFKDYISDLEQSYGSAIKTYKFRHKKWSWYRYNTYAKFNNGREYIRKWGQDFFSRGFLQNFYLRNSCYNCRFCQTNRPSDITMADFWGYKSVNKADINKDKGISLILINTPKGDWYFEKIKSQLSCFERTIEDAKNGNPALYKCQECNPKTEKFWASYNSCGYKETMKKFIVLAEINFEDSLTYKFGYNTILYKIFYKLLKALNI